MTARRTLLGTIASAARRTPAPLHGLRSAHRRALILEISAGPRHRLTRKLLPPWAAESNRLDAPAPTTIAQKTSTSRSLQLVKTMRASTSPGPLVAVAECPLSLPGMSIGRVRLTFTSRTGTPRAKITHETCYVEAAAIACVALRSSFDKLL